MKPCGADYEAPHGPGLVALARSCRGPKTGLLLLGEPTSNVDQPPTDTPANCATTYRDTAQRAGPARPGIEAKRLVIHEVVHNLSPFWLYNCLNAEILYIELPSLSLAT